MTITGAAPVEAAIREVEIIPEAVETREAEIIPEMEETREVEITVVRVVHHRRMVRRRMGTKMILI